MKNKLLLAMILGAMLFGVTGCRNDNDTDLDNYDPPVNQPDNNEIPDDTPPVPDFGDDGWEDGEYPEP